MSKTRSSPGPAVLLAAAAGNVLVWLAARPAGQPTGRFIGELCGAEAIVLFSCSLVLATLLPFIESAFGGLDRVFVWHRRVAVAGMVMLVPHLAFITSSPDPFETTLGHGLGNLALAGLLFLTCWALAPRLRAARWPGPIRALARTSHEHWVTAHRLTGLFVTAAVAHAAIVAPSLHSSTVLRVEFIAVGTVGIVAYLYRELVARYVIPSYDYTVDGVKRLNETTVEIALKPVGKALTFTPGQFVVLAFGGQRDWQRHPFSISSAPSDGRIGATIKASGDYTGELVETISRGAAARVVGPFGGFDYRTGRRAQVWIAGGMGITPFISWVRSLDASFDRDVDFYYSARTPEDAVYHGEIEAAGDRLPTLRTHLVYSDSEGMLTADEVMGAVGPAVKPSIYMCGPGPMTRSLARGFFRLGVPRENMRWEDFGVR
jgi:predicted ferric reductase